MPNDRLRSTMLERGVTPADLATALQVDPKSVERWIKGRGFPASQAPVLHLRRVAGGDMVTTYLESFERVWEDAVPLERG